MNTAIFESTLLSDGSLYCPKEFSQKKKAVFKVIVTFEDVETEASARDIELASLHDTSTEFSCLSAEELSYYFNT